MPENLENPDAGGPNIPMVSLNWLDDEVDSHRVARGCAACGTTGTQRNRAGHSHGRYIVVSMKLFAILHVQQSPVSVTQPSDWSMEGSWMQMSGMVATGSEMMGFGPVVTHPRLPVHIGGSGGGSQLPIQVHTWMEMTEKDAARSPGKTRPLLNAVIALKAEETGFFGCPRCPECRSFFPLQ